VALSASQITVTPNVTTVGGVVVLVDLNFAADFNNTTGSPIDYTIDYTLVRSRPSLMARP
jgi:hypothetical protein